jgi:hypothetical protein
VHVDRLRHLEADGQCRIERRHRFLEDHRDLVAADRPNAGIVELHKVDAVEQNFAALDPAGRVRDQPQHRQRGDAFAGPRFADDRQRFAGIDVERHVIDRGDGAAFGVKPRGEVVYLE